MKKCQGCRKRFEPNRFTPYQKYCSDECRWRHYRTTHREQRRGYRKAYYAKHGK